MAMDIKSEFYALLAVPLCATGAAATTRLTDVQMDRISAGAIRRRRHRWLFRLREFGLDDGESERGYYNDNLNHDRERHRSSSVSCYP